MPRSKTGPPPHPSLTPDERARFRTPVLFEPPVFAGSSPAALEYLDEYGYVVLQVLTDDEVARAEATFWRQAGEAFGWVKGLPHTWSVAEKWSTMANRTDCGHLRGWDHSEFRWELVKNERVQTAFADVCRHFAGASREEVQELLASPHLSPYARPEWRTTAEP